MAGKHKEGKQFCQSGIHRMVEGAFRLEEVKAPNGRTYTIRRCKKCQSTRVNAWNKANRKPKEQPNDIPSPDRS
jgi:hypothetical protein